MNFFDDPPTPREEAAKALDAADLAFADHLHLMIRHWAYKAILRNYTIGRFLRAAARHQPRQGHAALDLIASYLVMSPGYIDELIGFAYTIPVERLYGYLRQGLRDGGILTLAHFLAVLPLEGHYHDVMWQVLARSWSVAQTVKAVKSHLDDLRYLEAATHQNTFPNEAEDETSNIGMGSTGDVAVGPMLSSTYERHPIMTQDTTEPAEDPALTPRQEAWETMQGATRPVSSFLEAMLRGQEIDRILMSHFLGTAFLEHRNHRTQYTPHSLSHIAAYLGQTVEHLQELEHFASTFTLPQLESYMRHGLADGGWITYRHLAAALRVPRVGRALLEDAIKRSLSAEAFEKEVAECLAQNPAAAQLAAEQTAALEKYHDDRSHKPRPRG